MRKTYLSEMTWPEVKEIVDEDPVILVPLGTTEAQCRHNPIGYDYFVAQRLSEEAAKRSNALVLPVVPFGESEIFRDFPGTIVLRPSTLENLLFDIVDSLLRHGFKHIVFVNNHDPNKPVLSYALTRIREKYGYVFPSLWPTELARLFANDLFSNPKDVLMHGNEPSTSLCQYLCPDLLRMDLAVESPKPSELGYLGTLMYSSSNTLSFQGKKSHFHIRVSDVSSSGGYGKPSGDGEIGKKIFNQLVDYLVGFVEEFRNCDNKFN